MRILIIEHEQNAIERLEKMISLVAPEKKITGICRSIGETIQWLNENEFPDLILSDVQLPDGLSFEIFNQLVRKTNIIFISAFDSYAIQAFKTHGLHYLLKPVKKEELKEAIDRYTEVSADKKMNLAIPVEIQPIKYQERFIIRTGVHMKLVYDIEIAFIYIENKVVFAVNFNKQKFLMPGSIETLEKILNPKIFYRINRQVIVNINSIRKMTSASKQRIQLTLEPPLNHEAITSFERTQDFKKWLMGDL